MKETFSQPNQVERGENRAEDEVFKESKVQLWLWLRLRLRLHTMGVGYEWREKFVFVHRCSGLVEVPMWLEGYFLEWNCKEEGWE